MESLERALWNRADRLERKIARGSWKCKEEYDKMRDELKGIFVLIRARSESKD